MCINFRGQALICFQGPPCLSIVKGEKCRAYTPVSEVTGTGSPANSRIYGYGGVSKKFLHFQSAPVFRGDVSILLGLGLAP